MKNASWISTKDKLPRNGQWVLAKLDGFRYSDGRFKKDKNEIVKVKFIKGITEKRRENLRKRDKQPQVGGWSRGSSGEMELTYHDRSDAYQRGDVHGNNLVPYVWELGHNDDYHFGQEVYSWMPLPEA